MNTLGLSILTVWPNIFLIKAFCHALGWVCKFVQRSNKFYRIGPWSTLIYFQALAVKALTHELLENYEQAKESYEKLCKSSQQSSSSRLFSEGYVNCLENLCEWNSVSDFCDEQIGNDVVTSLTEDSWKDSFLLSHVVSSKLHMMAEGQDLVYNLELMKLYILFRS